MPTRNRGEKERIQKRIRRENLIRALVIGFSIVLFIVLSIVFRNSKSEKTILAEQTPAPTMDPCFRAVFDMGKYYNKSFTEGDGVYLLSFDSEIDEREVTVKLYKKDGIPCMKIVREVDYIEVEKVQEGIFDKWRTQPIKEEESQNLKAVSAELVKCISFINKNKDTENIEAKIYSSVLSLFSNGSTSSSFISGTYSINIELNISGSSVLTLICEPI